MLHRIFSNTLGVYKPPALPSGAAQGVHYPAGTQRFKLSLHLPPRAGLFKFQLPVRVSLAPPAAPSCFAFAVTVRHTYHHNDPGGLQVKFRLGLGLSD